jgi:L-asparaginase II
MNPVLVETTRGTEVESVHRGAACVVNAEGDVLASRSKSTTVAALRATPLAARLKHMGINPRMTVGFI